MLLFVFSTSCKNVRAVRRYELKKLTLTHLLMSLSYIYSPPPVTDIEVKSLNKRASGQAFEVILKSPTEPSPERPQTLALPPQKKETSLRELQKRLQAAEERRKVR